MSDAINDIQQADEQIDEVKGQEKVSRATQLVKLALTEGAELFHTPEGEAYATVPIDGRRETWPLKTKTIRRWLARLFFVAREEAPGSQAIQDALGVLEGKALFDGLEHPVHVRTAEYDRNAATTEPRGELVGPRRGSRDHRDAGDVDVEPGGYLFDPFIHQRELRVEVPRRQRREPMPLDALHRERVRSPIGPQSLLCLPRPVQ